MTAPPLSPAEQAVVDAFDAAPDPYAEVASRASVAHRCKTCGVGVDKCMEFRAGRRPRGQDSFCCSPCRVIGSHYDEDDGGAA